MTEKLKHDEVGAIEISTVSLSLPSWSSAFRRGFETAIKIDDTWEVVRTYKTKTSAIDGHAHVLSLAKLGKTSLDEFLVEEKT